MSRSLLLGTTLFGSFAGLALIAACSSDATPGTPAGTASAKCAAPGKPTEGPTDAHCTGKKQAVNPASCSVTAEAGAGDDDDEACEWGATQFGTAGTDDDCKYTMSYVSDPICEGAAGVQFTLTVKNNTDGTPVSGIAEGVDIEAYIPTDPTAACDSKAMHPSPSTAALKETAPGSGVYKGPVVFDMPGQWTVRFHIHENCSDVLPDSPHGHIAFRFTVP